MNSEEISIIATNPFIRKFAFAVIKSIQIKSPPYEEKQVIHADLVPKVSEKVMFASLRERTTPKRKDMSGLIAPMPRPIVAHTQISPPNRRVPLQIKVSQMTPPLRPISPPNIPHGTHIELSQDYGKITLLLHDPSVSTIECQGAGKPIMITRAGQRQITRIVLGPEDIKNLFNKIADATHIPLLEGVFRATVDNFSINAVISEIIGSRFTIKKQTAYAMLER